MTNTEPTKQTTENETPLLSPASILSTLGIVIGFLICASIIFGFVNITVVNGKSMNPTYSSGDVIIAIKKFEYAIGDVITYHPHDLECGRCNIIHRIIDGDSTGYVTQGDNNDQIDPWKPTPDEIKGATIFHIPLGEFSTILFSPKLWLAIIALTLTGILITFWRKPEKKEPTNV